LAVAGWLFASVNQHNSRAPILSVSVAWARERESAFAAQPKRITTYIDRTTFKMNSCFATYRDISPIINVFKNKRPIKIIITLYLIYMILKLEN
jgi:hypothetical protein